MVDQTEGDLKKMVYTLLIMSYLMAQVALWYKIDIVQVKMKHLEEKVKGFENAITPAVSEGSSYE